MLPGRGKSKGSAYENEIARREFSPWSGHQFIRTPQSGGMREVTKADLFCKELMISGDDILFIECKTRKQLCLHTLLEERNSRGQIPLFSWFDKASKDARREHKIPVVVFTQNNRCNLIAFKKDIWLLLKSKIKTKYYIVSGELVILPLQDFFTILFKEVVSILKPICQKFQRIDKEIEVDNI